MLKNIRQNKPLVHCITNPISINQCANTILALGAKPIMAEHPCEVEEITKTSDSLLLNIGNITDTRMKSFLISARTANKNDIPFVLDAVGVSCSELRRNYVFELIEKFRPTILKGNYSEINSLFNTDYRSKGVDSDSNLSVEEVSENAASLAEKLSVTIVVSGESDIITNGSKIFYIKNGTHQLSRVTGTGCMLGAICACFLPFDNSFFAAVKACATLGICGELSETEKGNGSFFVNLLDNLSVITDETIDKFIKLEEVVIEKY